MFETLKEWVAAGNPGLITKEEFARLESRVDELAELVTELEQRVDRADAETKGASADTDR